MAMLDLDALAPEPFIVLAGGQEYPLSMSVGTLTELAKAQEGLAPMDFAALMLEKAGLPKAVFLALDSKQVAALNEAATRHFFGHMEAAETTATSDGETP